MREAGGACAGCVAGLGVIQLMSRQVRCPERADQRVHSMDKIYCVVPD
jgi:hypothetical protein